MACRWQPGMKITALLDALNSALAEPFALAWVSNSPRFLLVFTVIYAVAVIVAVTDQKNTRPGAEHGVLTATAIWPSTAIPVWSICFSARPAKPMRRSGRKPLSGTS